MYFNLKYKVQPFYASVFDTFEFIFDAVQYLNFSVLLTPLLIHLIMNPCCNVS